MALPYYPGRTRTISLANAAIHATNGLLIKTGRCRVLFISVSCDANASTVAFRNGITKTSSVIHNYDFGAPIAGSTLYVFEVFADFDTGLFLTKTGTGLKYVNITLEG